MWGEKRQVIKSVTECSGFDRSRFASLSSMRQKVDTIATGCWMMTCATLWNNQLEKPQTTTIGRALSFCQQVMANEKAATVERRITTATDKAQDFQKRKRTSFMMHALALKNTGNEPNKILSASEVTSFEGQMRKIFQKRVLRIAQWRCIVSPAILLQTFKIKSRLDRHTKW